MTSEEILLVEQRDSVRILTFNRPEARNALSSALIDALRTEIAAAEADDETNVVVLTGTDPAFCAGLDLQELGESGGNLSLVSGADLPVGHPWKPISKPIIGAVNGAAITGGLEMALACDFLIASERARFADTHARVGVLPGWGLTQRLPAAVGPGFARRMSLSGNFVGAEEALRAGLVTQVVAHDELLGTAVEVARTIAGNDQSGVRALLASYRRAEEHVVEPALRWTTDGFFRLWRMSWWYFPSCRRKTRPPSSAPRSGAYNVMPRNT